MGTHIIIMENVRNFVIHDLFSSSNIIRLTNSRGGRCVGTVKNMLDERNAYRILVGKPERENREDLGIDGR